MENINRKAGLGYYENICYHIFAKNDEEREIQLADGGSVNWVGQFLNSGREHGFSSGFGSELIQKLFIKK